MLYPASTVVVLRNGPPSSPVEAYLVRRPASAAFMGGAHVFPGGRVDAEDSDADLLARCDGVPRRLATPPEETPLPIAFGVAAVRELLEESGLLLARTDAGEIVAGGDLEAVAAWRARVCRGADSFATACRAAGWRPALDRLVPYTHWITPEIEGRRFDTRFFLAKAPPGQVAAHHAEELSHGEWFGVREAVARHEAGDIVLAPPTLRTLWDLAPCPTVDAALASADAAPFAPILPRVHREAGRVFLVLPGDPLYPAGEFGVLPPPRRFVKEGARWVPQPQ